MLTGGQVADCTAGAALLEHPTDWDILHADKGYDSDAIRRQDRDRGAWANIPPKANRKWKNSFSPFLYRNRNAIERMFRRLKDFRRVATRYVSNGAEWGPRIGQESFDFGDERGGRNSSLDELLTLIDWSAVERVLAEVSCAAKGEPAWPPLALFKATLLAVWYDLSDVKLAEALDDRSSFRRFCGFSGHEATPERTAFVRFRKTLAVRGLDRSLFDAITFQLKAKAIRMKTGTLIDATIVASASADDGEARWVKHKGRPAQGNRLGLTGGALGWRI